MTELYYVNYVHTNVTHVMVMLTIVQVVNHQDLTTQIVSVQTVCMKKVKFVKIVHTNVTHVQVPLRIVTTIVLEIEKVNIVTAQLISTMMDHQKIVLNAIANVTNVLVKDVHHVQESEKDQMLVLVHQEITQSRHMKLVPKNVTIAAE